MGVFRVVKTHFLTSSLTALWVSDVSTIALVRNTLSSSSSTGIYTGKTSLPTVAFAKSTLHIGWRDSP